MADEFRAVAARVHGVSHDSILAGNGSDDILQIALRTYCGPGDVLVCPDPTYSLYPVLAELADVRLMPVPWEPGWRLPTKALLSEPRARDLSSRIPTRRLERRWRSPMSRRWRWRTDGARARGRSVRGLCRRQLPEPARATSRTCSSPARSARATVSPACALATRSAIRKSSRRWPRSKTATTATRLPSRPRAPRSRMWSTRARTGGHSSRTRQTLLANSSGAGFAVIPSQANFLLVTTPDAAHAGWLYAALKARGVLVRFFDKPGLDNKLRISVGAPAENDALLAAARWCSRRSAGRHHGVDDGLTVAFALMGATCCATSQSGVTNP